MKAEGQRTISTAQKLFLAGGVPCILLVFLELAARLVNLPGLLENKTNSVKLEMPTWMLRDDNIRARINPAAMSADDADWWKLFEEGSGFRVRMKPHNTALVSNTFSLIPWDRGQKYLIKTNALGFRGEDLPSPKPPGTFRILLFGDSSTFGWGVQQDENYPAIMQAELEKAYPGKRFETGNFAMPGDSSEYGMLVFETFMQRWEPDLVILGFGANDAKKTTLTHHRQVQKFKEKSGLQETRRLLEYSSLYRSLQKLIERVGGGKKVSAPAKQVAAVRMKRYRKNLLTMAQQSLAAGSKAVGIVTLCTPGDYARTAEQAAEVAPALFFNGQAYLKNLIPELQKKKLHPELVREMEANYPAALQENPVFYITTDGCHPNKLGHRIVGEKLAEIVKNAAVIK